MSWASASPFVGSCGALCEYYGAELHNFSPNSISQAAVFVAVCKGYLGVEAHWELWKHLFRGELYTEHVQ